MLRQAQFAVAQILSRPGRQAALSRLLDSHDLPGAWQAADERTWLTGRLGPPTPWGRRASAAGSVTAWRSFRAESGRWAWVQVMPMTSEQDARQALRDVGGRMLANPRAEVRIVSEHDVELAPFAGASSVWAHEQHTRPVVKRGDDGVNLLLAAAVGPYVTVLDLSGTPTWDWGSASDLAARQAARLVEAGPAQSAGELSQTSWK